MKKEFKKFFNRDISLVNIECWWQGEFNGLKKITKSKAYFNPLFIFRENKGVDVYYDINNSATNPENLVNYFKRRKEEFNKLAEEYKRDIFFVEKLAREKNYTKKSFIDLFNRAKSIWPLITIMVILGKNKEFKVAYKLRQKTDGIEYLMLSTLNEIVKKLFPKFKIYYDVLLFDEILNPEKIKLGNLKKRKRGYIFFENKLYKEKIKEMEKEKNLILSKKKNMKIKYEKHQRDYTFLGTSQVAREFFSERMVNYFSYSPHPFYFLVEKEALYHYIQSRDYESWVNAWAKKYSYRDLQKFIKETNKILSEYNKFLKQRHTDLSASLQKLHHFMRILTPSAIITAYVPEYCKNIDKRINDLCLKYRNKNDDVHKVGMTLHRRLLNKLEKKLNLKKDTLEYLNSDEFEQFLLTKKVPKDLAERKDFVFIEESSEGEKFLKKKEALSKLKEIDETRKKISADKIKGSVAFKGNVKGRVRIIRLIKEAIKIKEGDVLVTSMTDPRYISAMKKAVAIITDEGGITCHAAIVARELKKPCIIGTKIATQVLKDGDLVEVDADKGIVKILKR